MSTIVLPFECHCFLKSRSTELLSTEEIVSLFFFCNEKFHKLQQYKFKFLVIFDRGRAYVAVTCLHVNLLVQRFQNWLLNDLC